MSSPLRLQAGEHVVYFYDDERRLARVVASYLAAALAEGGSGLAIATPAHRDDIMAEIRRRGLDVERAQRDSRLVFLDAADTLARFFVDGAADAGRFRAAVAPQLEAVHVSDRPLHAFGEMVGLLWDVGDVDGAIAVEDLWNALLADLDFSLLCGYPSSALRPETAPSALRVCGTHSDLLCAAPVPADAQVSRSFPGLPQSPGRARAFVAETLADWGLTELSDSAALVVTELAVNAVRHAQTDFTVSLARNDRRLRITVGDADSARPRRRSTDLRTDSGRGLLIVDALSTGWGSTPMGAGKLVWADLDSPT